MESSRTHYEVALQVCEPKFDTERRYIEAELEFVQRQLTAAGRWMSLSSMGIYSRKDWVRYQHDLEHYAHALDQHKREIDEGWLPFKIHILNAGPHDDNQVSVRLEVENGAISTHKKAPNRPPRMDSRRAGPSSKLQLPHFGGFARSGVKIRRHDMQATFSKLEAGSSADLVRKVLYLHYNAQTKLSFELNSQLVKHLTGELAS
jgi:hypothetical protein